ncbi:type I glutamate--ammonia ligase [Thiomicrorhabdus xiamenensis]|uniref:Glutamine synthetase n=1 Tax=Thiomicrorhabdus xiamenensis TaxID=2739063 RepID=A0A7D4TEU7_9GAMM|nr:type I glutamate--ammonia ligase [Thiomicrorhabdus xiamenensis]QKI89707.1 type I glutamate--ammonia ligase [Thiomicrorhabdus xiamenensis]
MPQAILDLIKENDVKWADLRFTDTHGKEQHVTIPASRVDEDFFTDGETFDGSSIQGWKGINQSDMILMPQTDGYYMDPFTNDPTIVIRMMIVEPSTMEAYEKDPRGIAKKAEAYLKSTGIADTAFFGPEPEFFIFDDVRWGADMSGSFVKINAGESTWEAERVVEGGNLAHRPRVKGGYFPVPPVDQLHEVRADICAMGEAMGLKLEAHHHEVAGAGQCELAVAGNTLTAKADEVQILKYAVHNTCQALGKTATFMPKPIVGDNGTGMHINQSLSKDGKNIFAGDIYSGLSQEALWYLGGLMKHARALNAFCNPGTNSYKRLVPGFEAPILIAYSGSNRSASIRIPYAPSERSRRVELRFPDPTANPYLAFSACLMAGLDGIMNKIDPGAPSEKDLYDLEPEEEAGYESLCASLEEALDALDKDREFLTAGGVFTDEAIDSYIKLKMEDVTRLRATTHPIEFDMYYSS